MASHIQLPFLRASRSAQGPLHTYVTLVALGGLPVCVWSLRDVASAYADASQQIAEQAQVPLTQVHLTFWLLVACALPAELIRMTVRIRGGPIQITLSRPLILAMLIGWGAPLTAVVFVATSLVTDLIHRRPAVRIAFNAGQYALAIAAADGAYLALGGQRWFTLGRVPAFLAAFVVLTMMNRLLVRVAVALHEQRPMSIGFLFSYVSLVELAEFPVQCGMVLVALVVAQHRPVLVALLALPAPGLMVAGALSERLEGLLARWRRLGGDELADLEQRRETALRTVELQRAMLAADLHDGPVRIFQELGARLQLVQARIAAGEPDAARLLREVEEQVEEQTRQQRLWVAELRPLVLQRQGLAEALTRLAEQFQTTSGIECAVTVGAVHELSEELTTLLWRVTQEALTNVAKHAHAKHVQVMVAINDGTARLEIHDDGTGFDPEAIPDGHYGLTLKRQEVELAGGTFLVDSTPEFGGTTITVEIEVGRHV